MPGQEPTIATPGHAQQLMSARLYGIEHLLQGTEAMRDAGEDFLPRYDQETDRVYENRLSRAVLYNYFKRTAQALGGRPFREEVKITNASERLTALLSDIDTQGRSLHSFLHDAFFIGVTRSFVGILADHPSVPDGIQTLEQQRALNLRPYGRLIEPRDFVDGYAKIENGKEVITHVRFWENAIVRVPPWGWEMKQRIRLLAKDPDRGVYWELWEVRKAQNGREEWAMINDGEMSLPEIPLTIFYAGEREGFLLAEPPLKDLADLNISHWQSYSDQIHVLTVARFPILFATGVDTGKDSIDVGPNKCLTAESADAKFGYVEHSGAAIAAGRQDLQDLETRMATMGVDLMVKRSGDRASATARTIDESRGGSVLQAMAQDFSHVASQFLGNMERWMGNEDPNVLAELNSDFGLALKDQAELAFLMQMRQGRDLSRERLLIECKRRNVLPEVFDEEANEEELEAEGPSLDLFKTMPDPSRESDSDSTPSKSPGV